MEDKKRSEKLIMDNRSSKPLFEVYDKAFDFYFQEWSEEYKKQAMVLGDLTFYRITNKESVTIQIYDYEN